MIVINKRVYEIRTDMHLSQEEFGRRLGVGKSAISYMESGRSKITEQMVKLICKEFDVNENWLRSGTGSMKVEYLPEDEYVRAAAEIAKDDDEETIRQVIIEYYKLNPEGKRHIKEYILNIAKSLAKKEELGE